MNQTNGDSKTEIIVTGLSIEKVKENEKEQEGTYTFKIIDGGKIAEPVENIVEIPVQNGKLNENDTIENENGNIIKFKQKGYSQVAKNKQLKIASKEKYKKFMEAKKKDDTREVG